MRVRTQLITDIVLKEKDLKALANGYRVYKRANKHAHCLVVIREEDKKAKQIKALEEKLAKLKSQTKRPYTKKNEEHWAKGGNLANFNKNRKEGRCQLKDSPAVSAEKESALTPA